MANVLGELFGDIATAIRSKTGEEGTMKPAEFPKKIKTIGLTTVYELQSVTGFQFDSTFGAFSPGFVSPSEFVLKPKKNYIVCWDDVDYTCEAFSFTLSGMTIVAIGNASSLGLSGNNEPFLITYNVTANNTQFHSTEQKAEHTIGIYTMVDSQSGGSSDDLRYVTFMSYDGSVEYGKKAVATGDDCADPIARGVFDTPTRESTAQYNYTFSGGWATVPNGGKDANALKAVTEDRTVYANFVEAVRYYTITFYDSDGSTVLATKSVAYGSVPSYTPEKDGNSFIGWSPELVAVTGNASYSAQWEERVTFANGSWADIARISEEGKASEYFKVGDTRTITFSGSSLTLAIAGFNHDDLADGSGKAGMTIVTMNVPPWTRNWHWNDHNTTGLYDKCDLSQKYLPKWFETPYLPDDLRTCIKSVNKDYDTSVNSGTASGTVSCNLFVLSLTELGGKPYSSTATSVLGKRYALFPELSSANTAPTANKAGTSTKANYWTRNIYRVGVLQPTYISTDGSYTRLKSGIDTTQHYVRFGFCI